MNDQVETGGFSEGKTEIQKIVQGRVENLRNRLLDSSRRNPLIQVPFRANSSTLIRFVDELPDDLSEKLSNQTEMRLVSLPAIDEPLPDEQTDEFLSAVDIARGTDEVFLSESENLDPTDEEYAQKEMDLERDLKDRVRVDLGLPERQTEDNPSLAVHASTHGISPDYILPDPAERHDDGRHDDTDIQTLLLPERLDRVGRSLHDRGHSFERETGVNVLHAAFGILEWSEPGSARGPSHSPLLLLEVRMDRKKAPAGLEFYIRGEGGLEVNTTLSQTFSSQFGLQLPVYEGGSIEDYFEQITDLAPSGWHWKVRREALVGVFPSSRIAMYRDLDPETRPVVDNEIIQSLLSTAGGAVSYAEVYETDDPEVERRVPRLVMDADASQFSSLVDASMGQNIAIEGPPGSGKSQTIVNLIASAMGEGKRVLFVAEKLTALDVVRNRLDAVGLGEFVLPLQAGSGSRASVFQSLEARLDIPKPGGAAAAAHKAGHEALCARRARLQSYLDMLGTDVGHTGLTVHEAMGKAIATSDSMNGLPRDIRRLRVPGAEHMTLDNRKAFLADATMVLDRLGDNDRTAALWRDAGKAPVRVDEAEEIASEFTALLNAIDALRNQVKDEEVQPFLPQDPILADQAVTLLALRAVLENNDADAALVEQLIDEDTRARVLRLCDAQEARTQAHDRLVHALTDPSNTEIDAELERAALFARAHDDIIDPAALAKTIEDLEKQRADLETTRALALALPARWAETDNLNLSDICLDLEMLMRSPDAVLARRTPDDSRSIPATAKEVVAAHAKLATDLSDICKTLSKAGKDEVSDIEGAAKAIEDSGIFRMFSGDYKSAWAFFCEKLGGNAKTDRADAVSALRDYATWARKRDAFARDIRYTTTLGDMFKGMESDCAILNGLATFHETVSRISQGDDRLRYALEAGSLDPLRAFLADAPMPAQTLKELVSEISEVEIKLDRARQDAKTGQELVNLFRNASHPDIDLISSMISARKQLLQARETIRTSSVPEVFKSRDDTDTIRKAGLIATAISLLPDPQKAVDLLGTDTVPAILESADRIFAKIESLSTEADSLAAEISLKVEDATSTLHTLCARADDIREAAAKPEGLVNRALLLRSTEALGAYGIGELVAWVQSEEGSAQRDNLVDVAEAILARSLMDCIQSIHGSLLDAHDGADLARLRQEIASIDKEMTKTARKAIREELLINSHPPRGNGTGRVGTFTEMSLIRHELNKVRNHIGVRDLTARAGQALINLKPCWMMSPLAVAQYLHDGLKFDLVVIDEASQMTPENALGAVMRAKQVVVVGDTKQLPPTNFFQKVLESDDEDEDARTDSESILDMANTTFCPVRQLRWHYRSRHPHLIALSNKMIYDEQLTIFPAARDNDPSLGVSLVEIEGTYKKGRNVIEARAIVAGAIAHMRDHPDRSLGLATMNKEQTELIFDEFERERDRHPHVEAFIERWAQADDGLEEFFVKNLETIQGDERDVIMISTLYGPDPEAGKTYQRFGPIASAHGHRRLNVLFSRAKRRMVTYTSMKPNDIQAEGKAYGVQMLRAWLEFSRSGQISEIRNTRAETESPFEDYVLAQVEAAGFEAIPQVGASGYRIDIGVRHPDWPYGYVLAVECDGATYHSSRSSRDRDRLRQEVLEGLGWRFHRIWSTDWFRDPRGQIVRLKKAMEDALEAAKKDEIKSQEARARAAQEAIEAAEAAAQRAAEEAEAAKSAEEAEKAKAAEENEAIKAAAKAETEAEEASRNQGDLFAAAQDAAETSQDPGETQAET
jgi:very-short-patch-repair endonuclease/DNA polymerase III delta prime subunit